MKRKNLAVLLCVMTILVCSGCNKKVDEVLFSSNDDSNQIAEEMNDMENDEQNKSFAEEKEDAENNGETIQEEIARIEAKSKEIEEAAQSCMTQTDMNLNAGEWYQVWDEELNSLWNRLTDEVDIQTKGKLLGEQRDWIARKEANIKEAEEECMGGSILPAITNSIAAEMTRARVYELAGYLAEERGESFSIPDDIQAELDMADFDTMISE